MAEGNYENEKIIEGFLCPVCHKDLRSPNNLLEHFESVHSEEQDLLSSIKDLVGRAKKKILKSDEQDVETYKEKLNQSCYLTYSKPQAPGQSRVHTEYFKTIRRERLGPRTSETNNLIIRLDRLLTLWHYGSERKQQEQKQVTWLDGTTVTRCPSCTASFNITRRQHHCRLCGSIMCNSCSYFLPYNVAQTLVAPVYNADTQNKEMPSKVESKSLRICDHCRGRLENRRRAQIDQMVQPIICQLYSHLQKLKSQTEPCVEQYHKIYNSLISGDKTFQIQEAQSLHATIAQQAEMMDTISKKIASLPIDPDTPRAASLQNNIKRGTSQYIKDRLLTLPALPSISELERIRKERSQERETQLTVQKVVKIKKVAIEAGWTPSSVIGGGNSTEDPLVEQMNNVEHYIKQAELAQRFEEAYSLKENLKMLREMYRKKQKEMQKITTDE